MDGVAESATEENAPSNVFASAAQRGQKIVTIGDAEPCAAPIPCDGCARPLEAPLAFLSLSPTESGQGRFCGDCRAAFLGPPCAGCNDPVARADGLLAADKHWHRNCLRCADSSCGMLLGERYFVHEQLPYCREHYLDLAGERCGACGLVVDGGLKALGRAWHDECFRCAETNEPLGVGRAFLHEGRPIGPDARLVTAARCHACSEPAVVGRIFAHGCVYHSDCFRCVHCRVLIGERKFVVFDGEPYLEGCYQKLFGASAGEAMRTQIHGTHHRFAVQVPLQMQLGTSALANFRTKHEEMLPQVRRLLREAGITQFASFIFLPPAVSKPSLILQMLIPTTLDAETILNELLQADRIGQQWQELLTSAHDSAAARGNSWWSTISRELGTEEGSLQAENNQG